MKISPLQCLVFISILLCDHFVFSRNNSDKSKAKKGEFWFVVPPFIASRQFLEESLQRHPLFCTSLVAATLSCCLYPDKVKDGALFLYEHRPVVLGCSFAALAIAYRFKQNIIKNLVGSAEDESETEEGDGLANFSRSGVRVYGPGEIKTTFTDVAGLQTVKEDLSDILMFLKYPKKFNAIGAHVPKGVLLSGSPGNGKTLLARALAGEAKCPFLYIAASEFIESIVGMGAARIRHLFSVAKELAPCIVFIDEIDAIGSKRTASGSGGDRELTQSLNQFLAEMDGFEQQKYPIIIIAATNRADVLDEALLRSGRFDRKLEVHSPFIKDRVEILKIHLKNVKNKKIDVEKIARGTVGFSGADLANLINEAAINALRKGMTYITMNDIDQARDFMLLGRETKGMDISQEEFWNTAVHESGHALTRVFQLEAYPLYKVTITPRGGALGLTYGMELKEKYSRSEVELRCEIVVALGGSVAEEMILGNRGVGARSDLEKARELATAMVMKYGMTQEFKDITFVEFVHNQVHLPDEIATKLHKEVACIINECRAVAYQILLEHKDELLKLSEMLLQEGTVQGKDVYQLCGMPEPKLDYSLSE